MQMATFTIGVILVLVSLVFGGVSTAYFGFNWHPQSTAEWICDGITVAINLLGFALIAQQ